MMIEKYFEDISALTLDRINAALLTIGEPAVFDKDKAVSLAVDAVLSGRIHLDVLTNVAVDSGSEPG